MQLLDAILSEKEGVFLSTSQGTLRVGYGGKQSSNTPKEGSWYFPDFFLKEESPFHLFEKEAELVIKENLLEPLSLTWESPDFTCFEHSFSMKGALKKWVPYVSFPCNGAFHLKELLQRAMGAVKRNPRSSLYGFWKGTQGMIGITPEKLFTLEGRTVTTMAVAGTATKEKAYLLEKDRKLVEEHELVVEGIEKALSPFGRFIRFPREVKTFGPLSHLISHIEVTLSHETPFDAIVKALHPTPALGTYPKSDGAKWLEEYAIKLPRKRFGAPFGYVGKEKADCVVAIRNLQWDEGRGEVLCGCGVTASSEFAAEKEEVCLKWRAVKEALGIV